MDNHLDVIDLKLGQTLVGDDVDMAKELLVMLANNLREHEQIIKHAFSKKDISALLKEAHKLHGATCYTGTPRLKQAAYDLEQAAKKNHVELIPGLVEQLETEIKTFTTAFEKLGLK